VTARLVWWVAREVPVIPDADTAREWARRELADPIYHEGESWLVRFLRWLEELLADVARGMGALDPTAAVVTLAVLAIVVTVVVLLWTGPVRRSRTTRGSGAVFEDDARTAAEIRASADAAAAAGRWGEAVVERFRAVLRSLEERAVLDERPGWTADEAAAAAGAVLPTCADDLRRASRLFDDVRYGDRPARADDDAWLRVLDRTVAATRPVPRADAQPAPVLVAPR
jgi:hypothetical protein